MKSFTAFHVLLIVLLILLLIVAGLAYTPQVANATGVPHPKFGANIMIGPSNIDQVWHTKWLGYLYGLSIIGVFWSFLTIGARKKGKRTIIAKWIGLCFSLYILAYTLMTQSHWRYTEEGGGSFVMMMPLKGL